MASTALEQTPAMLHRRFRGHRRASFVTADLDELTEMRARQRTFDGAFVRSALGQLSYALLILKLFSAEFAHIGLLYVVLGAIFFVTSIIRRRRSIKDFSDDNLPSDFFQDPPAPASKRVWGKRPFRPGGAIILGLSLCVAAVEVALLVLVIKLD